MSKPGEKTIFTQGKLLISFVNTATLFGPFLADWNETHIFNPNWPPHARYHNGQTMSIGLFIGLITYYTLFVLIPQTSVQQQRVHLNWILLLQNLPYLSSLSGILYPGAGWTDPEFGDRKIQLHLFPILIGACWFGWYVEMNRIVRIETGKGV